MSYKYFPPSKKPAKPRPCGLTRLELRNLRVLSGYTRQSKVKAWLLRETALAKYADAPVKLLAFAYREALARPALRR